MNSDLRHDDLRDDLRHDAWYYRRDGVTLGPISTAALQEMLALRRLSPRQPVWRQRNNTIVFVTADTAAALPGQPRRFGLSNV